MFDNGWKENWGYWRGEIRKAILEAQAQKEE
jgi:hypothetical protein